MKTVKYSDFHNDCLARDPLKSHWIGATLHCIYRGDSGRLYLQVIEAVLDQTTIYDYSDGDLF